MSGDGTFRIIPPLWKQTFILLAEGTKDYWVPALFTLLPDKKKDNLANQLKFKNLLVSATSSFFSDYVIELNIRITFR